MPGRSLNLAAASKSCGGFSLKPRVRTLEEPEQTILPLRLAGRKRTALHGREWADDDILDLALNAQYQYAGDEDEQRVIVSSLRGLSVKTKIGYAVAVLLALTAGFAQGQEKGIESITRECSTCHDTGAVSASSAIPLLAAQQAPYLVAQLKAFRDRSRPDPHAQTPMWSIAARLTDDVIAKIAAYYASQQPRQGTPTDPGETSVGKKIYEEGVEAQHVIACQLCHGPQAAGKGPFPRLAGQQRGYLERQLAAFAANLRAHAIMHENAKNLTTLQISQVAAFLSAAQ